MARKTNSTNNRYPFLPVLLFLCTFLLVRLYHHDYTLFAYFIASTLSFVGIWYAFKAFKMDSHISITMKEIDEMDEQNFHEFLISLFQRNGYAVKKLKKNEQTFTKIMLKKRGQNAIVCVKRQDTPVETDCIQNMLAMKPIYQATQLIMVTNQEFTKGAQQLARANKVNLIDRESLDAMIDVYFRDRRYPYFVERVRALFLHREREET